VMSISRNWHFGLVLLLPTYIKFSRILLISGHRQRVAVH